MTERTERSKFIPGTYAKIRPGVEELADRYIREWDQARLKAEKVSHEAGIPFTVCFSRKIGVGALEIADLLGEKLGMRVVDRQIVEYIAGNAQLSEKTVSFFDERYSGRMDELLSMAFGEKAFIKSDYSRHLFATLFSVAGLGPSIIVGRGAHLVLPRDRVLAVRIIGSEMYRLGRLMRLIHLDEEEARRKLNQTDREQRDFFKKVYGKKDASPYEFDMVVNCDFLPKPQSAVEIIAKAFEEKFGSPSGNFD